MLMVVAFALQGYVTQTHIHFAGQVVTGGFSFSAEGSKALSNKALGAARGHENRGTSPVDDDPANCPVCQQMLYAGHFVAPAAIALWLPTLSISTIAIVAEARPHFDAVSHFWHGRAPPLT
jgi:hypothetical protein